ncbi:MAG: TetR/AcrR family transcriptional regulator, partial [Ketobacter sp.]
MTPGESGFSIERGPDARERILAAAESLFAVRGFEGVSTTQIAKVAGITQPLIHYHFKNKEALWKATISR